MTNRYTSYTMADVAAAAVQARFTFATGFSGGGGADIGFALAGGRPIFGIELDREAARTFGRNFPDMLMYTGDLRDVAASPEIIGRILEQSRLRRGELDVLHISSPCNELSKLGRGPQPGGTAELLFDGIRLANDVRPRTLTIENVPQLGGRYRYMLEAAMKQLCQDPIGDRRYFANSMILMASKYGVPQRRPRLFVICVRADVAEAVGIRSDADVLRLFPTPTSAEISFEEAVAGLQQSEGELHPFRRALMVSNIGLLARKLEHDPTRWITPMKAGLGNTRFTTIRASSALPAPTITASGQWPDGRSGILHPIEHRKLSLREMMRCSSWPEDYAFTGTLSQACERIGMSVPPLMMKAVADAIVEGVLEPYRRTALEKDQTTRL